ncbi:MAG TPA: hypothetical protein VNI36_01200 [Candidatus Dormibacteraeota bacterium]|nr:hypothetical protein [Candidatus Dormibacteraeota bacterium]
MRQITRKLQAVAALLALLLASVPTLVDAFSSADMSACCNSMDCPMRHGQICGSQKHASDGAAQCNSMGLDCSMGSCDMSPKPTMQMEPFMLAVPLAIHSQMITEPAPAFVPGFIFSRSSVPSIPPPRTYPS